MSLSSLHALFATAVGDVPHFLGEKHLASKAAPPRVVWVPDDEAFTRPRQTSVSPKVVWQANNTIQIHLWVAEIDDVWTLRDRYLIALEDIAKGNYELGRGVWMPPQALWGGKGYGYVLPVTFFCAVERAFTEATITTVEKTCELEV